jgi:hypothetical protein
MNDQRLFAAMDELPVNYFVHRPSTRADLISAMTQLFDAVSQQVVSIDHATLVAEYLFDCVYGTATDLPSSEHHARVGVSAGHTLSPPISTTNIQFESWKSNITKTNYDQTISLPDLIGHEAT